MYQRFWSRWSSDYLHTLQQRKKWQSASQDIKIGDMVLILEDNLPPNKWALGRVLLTHPGADGHTRVVTVRTKMTTFKRAIVKLARLPNQEDCMQLTGTVSSSPSVDNLDGGCV